MPDRDWDDPSKPVVGTTCPHRKRRIAPLAPHSFLGEIPTMKITAIERRLVLPGAQPGETYAIWQDHAGHYELTKVVPAPQKNKPPRKIDALMKSAALTPKMGWEELHTLTREPRSSWIPMS